MQGMQQGVAISMLTQHSEGSLVEGTRQYLKENKYTCTITIYILAIVYNNERERESQSQSKH